MSRQLNFSYARLLFIAPAIALLVFSGCGPQADPLGKLTGKVTSGDQLIGNCKVAIYCHTTNRSIAADVDESATYELTEVPLGDYVVWVYPKPTDKEKAVPDPRIAMKYRSGKTSGFSVSVTSTEAIVYDIDLK